MGGKKQPLWKLQIDPTACLCLWLEYEGYTFWAISWSIRACSLIKSVREESGQNFQQGALFVLLPIPGWGFPSYCLEYKSWRTSTPFCLLPRALQTLRSGTWIFGSLEAGESCFTVTRKLAQKTSLPDSPGAFARRQVSTCFFRKGLPVESLPEACVNPEISGVWLRGPRGAWKAGISVRVAYSRVSAAASPFFPLRELGRLLNN